MAKKLFSYRHQHLTVLRRSREEPFRLTITIRSQRQISAPDRLSIWDVCRARLGTPGQWRDAVLQGRISVVHILRRGETYTFEVPESRRPHPYAVDTGEMASRPPKATAAIARFVL